MQEYDIVPMDLLLRALGFAAWSGGRDISLSQPDGRHYMIRMTVNEKDTLFIPVFDEIRDVAKIKNILYYVSNYKLEEYNKKIYVLYGKEMSHELTEYIATLDPGETKVSAGNLMGLSVFIGQEKSSLPHGKLKSIGNDLLLQLSMRENAGYCLSHQVSPQVLTTLKEKAKREGSIGKTLNIDSTVDNVVAVLADITGYTLLSESQDKKIRGIMSRLYDTVRECAWKYNGMISNYIGDGFFVLFNYPDNQKDGINLDCFKFACSFVHTAENILKDTRERFQEEYEQDRKDGYPVPFSVIELKQLLRIRVGMTSGTIYPLNVSPYEDLIYPTIISHTVNVASRLEGECDPGGIMIGEALYDILNSQYGEDAAVSCSAKDARVWRIGNENATKPAPIRLKGVTRRVRPTQIHYRSVKSCSHELAK